MYKLFLTFRYLTRKKIVIFPILVVWLCLMMMIIVTSIMGGFVDRVRQANRDLLGDIIISSEGAGGWSGYEGLRDALARKFPQIQATTPVVSSYGLAYLPYYNQTVPVRVIGIHPAERAKVSRFRETLFHQYLAPTQAVDDLAPRLPASREELLEFSRQHYDAAQSKLGAAQLATRAVRAKPSPSALELDLAKDNENRAFQARTSAERVLRYADALPAGQRFTSRQELTAALVPAEPSFDVPPAATEAGSAPEGAIVGVQIGMFPRDKRGNFERAFVPDNLKVLVTVFPVKARGQLNLSGITLPFTIVDDSYSGVYDVDSTYIYAPFETVQYMAGMRPDPELLKLDPTAAFPPKCHELLIKLKEPTDLPTTNKVADAMFDFVQTYQAGHNDTGPFPLKVQTWKDRQKKYLDAVENEKKMQTFILGLMSLVVLVVIFLIFYMIVRDKTRDIGIIKAVGGSEEGVAGIFLTYGLFIGIVGGILGVISGVAFVTHTNQIHEWLFQTFGIVIWDRSVYLFDRIPDTVNPLEVTLWFFASLAAGIVGALIPALVAAFQDPVQAVRYE